MASKFLRAVLCAVVAHGSLVRATTTTLKLNASQYLNGTDLPFDPRVGRVSHRRCVTKLTHHGSPHLHIWSTTSTTITTQLPTRGNPMAQYGPTRATWPTTWAIFAMGLWFVAGMPGPTVPGGRLSNPQPTRPNGSPRTTTGFHTWRPRELYAFPLCFPDVFHSTKVTR